MISQVNSSMVGSAYANNSTVNTEKKQASSLTTSSQNESKIDKIKESIGSGEYKVDLSALSKKMADELL